MVNVCEVKCALMAEVTKHWEYDREGEPVMVMIGDPNLPFPGSATAKSEGCTCNQTVDETYPEGGILLDDDLDLYCQRMQMAIYSKSCPIHHADE